MKNMIKTKATIRNFLKKNGFERMEKHHYANDKCSVDMKGDFISIADNQGDNVIIPVDIYAMIRVLVWWHYVKELRA